MTPGHEASDALTPSSSTRKPYLRQDYAARIKKKRKTYLDFDLIVIASQRFQAPVWKPSDQIAGIEHH
jgi:hypothetical protein